MQVYPRLGGHLVLEPLGDFLGGRRVSTAHGSTSGRVALGARRAAGLFPHIRDNFALEPVAHGRGLRLLCRGQRPKAIVLLHLADDGRPAPLGARLCACREPVGGEVDAARRRRRRHEETQKGGEARQSKKLRQPRHPGYYQVKAPGRFSQEEPNKILTDLAVDQEELTKV